MKHILLVFTDHVASREAALRCMQRIALSKEYNSPSAKDSTFVKTVTTGPEVEEHLDRSRSTNDWLSVEDTISVLTGIEKQDNAEECCAGSVPSDMETVAKGLHDAADSLPYLGSCIDTILCMGYPEAVAADSDSVIPVAGALKRLFDWHNGCALVVKLRHELSPLERDLAELAGCRVINSVDELNLNWPGWRGKVAVVDHIENKGHVFPACRLESPDWDSLVQQKLMCVQQDSTDIQPEADVSSQIAVCGRTAEVLQEVDLRTLPLCLLDSWSLHLHAAEQQSTILVKYIKDLDQTGVLARVRVYPDISKIPCCGSMKLSTAAWKDSVVSEVENMPEPPEEPVTDDWVYLYFLLLPGPSAARSSSVVAQVLLSPHEINSSVLPIVEAHIRVQKSVTKLNRHRCRNETVPCDELVLNQRDRFVMMLNLLRANLQNVLSEYQDDVSKGGHAYENILCLGADVQGQIISAAFHGCPSVQQLVQGQAGCIRGLTESALDPSKFPERLALQATEATRKVLQSFPSMDSLTSSSPLSATEVETRKDYVDFDVFEYFNHGGTLKETSTCPLKSARLKGRGLCRVDSQCMGNLQWPESMLLQYHDIFYYNSEINWSLEKRYSKVRDRGYFPDTRSSFVSPVKKTQQTHSMLRRSASAQSSVAGGRPERPPRISPRKARMTDIFKQPPSHLCSPRKPSQGSQNQITPELPLFSVFKPEGQLSSNSKAHSADHPKRSRESLSRKRARNPNIPSVVDISNQSHRKRSLTPSQSASACKRDRKLASSSLSHDVADLLCPVRRSLTPSQSASACKRDRKLVSSSSSHDIADLLCPVRRSPRRSGRPLRVSSDYSVNVSTIEKPDSGQGQCDDVGSASFEQQRVTEASLGSASFEQQRVTEASLGSASFEQQRVTEASLGSASFEQQRVTEASLGSASFEQQRVTEASLGSASFEQQRVKEASPGSASVEQQRVKEASLGSNASEQASAKMKRSERHKLKLQRIIDHVLREKGVLHKDRIYSACSRNLFNVSMVLLKTLTTSQNLTEEMKTVVYGQVTQIINLEKRRCGMAL